MTESHFVANFEQHLIRIQSNANIRRRQLLQEGQAKQRNKRVLTILAGIAALASATLATVAFSKILNGNAIEQITIGLGFLSGVLSIFITTHYREDEISSTFLGATEYLSLREMSTRCILSLPANRSQQSILKELTEQYSNLDEKYSKYYPSENSTDRKIGNFLKNPSVRGADNLGYIATSLLWKTTGTVKRKIPEPSFEDTRFVEDKKESSSTDS